MDKLKYMDRYSIDALDESNIEYPRCTLDNGEKKISVLAEKSVKTENGILTFKRKGKTYLLRNQAVIIPENQDWELDFYLDTVQSEVVLSTIAGYSTKPTITLEDFYGPEYDNIGRHAEVRFYGMDNGQPEEFAPDGVPVPTSVSSDEEIALAKNPDGFVEYDPDAKNLVFSSGSYGRKHYKLIYHENPIN